MIRNWQDVLKKDKYNNKNARRLFHGCCWMLQMLSDSLFIITVIHLFQASAKLFFKKSETWNLFFKHPATYISEIHFMSKIRRPDRFIKDFGCFNLHKERGLLIPLSYQIYFFIRGAKNNVDWPHWGLNFQIDKLTERLLLVLFPERAISSISVIFESCSSVLFIRHQWLCKHFLGFSNASKKLFWSQKLTLMCVKPLSQETDSLETRAELAVLRIYVDNQAILEPILLYRASKCKQTKEQDSEDCLWTHIFTFLSDYCLHYFLFMSRCKKNKIKLCYNRLQIVKEIQTDTA